MGYLMWGITSAAGAAGAAVGNIRLAVVAIAVALGASAGASIRRIRQLERERRGPNE